MRRAPRSRVGRSYRNGLLATIPFVLIVTLTLVVCPGLRPGQQWLTLVLIALGGAAAFEVRRRMNDVLRDFARAHGALSTPAGPNTSLT